MISEQSKVLGGITDETVKSIAKAIDKAFEQGKISPQEDKRLFERIKELKTECSYSALAKTQKGRSDLKRFFSKRKSEAPDQNPLVTLAR